MHGLRRESALISGGGQDILVVTRPETLKLISDPLRLRLLELLRDESRTVKELAAALDAPVTKLYYHVNLLLEHGLIRVTDTRLVSGITEKRYRVIAARLSVDRALLGPTATGDDGLEAWLSVVLDEAKAEIRKSVRAGLIDVTHQEPARRGLELGRKWLRLTPAQAQSLSDRICALIEEPLPDVDSMAPNPDAPNETAYVYEFLIGLYPTVPSAPEDS
jgi:DNA-binding transcriptional ArsR family regulator